MTDKTKLPKIVKTQETSNALANPDYAGQCHPRLNSGRPGVFVAVPEHIHPLIGVEGGAMVGGECVSTLGTVLGYVDNHGRVAVSDQDGYAWWVDPDAITPAPQTRTVTLEVEVPTSVDPRHLGLVERGREPYSGQSVSHRIIAIDGEEVGDEKG